MTDNLTLNVGTGGEELATDQAAGLEHYQRVKLVDGTADSTGVIASGNGTSATALSVSVSSDSTGQIKLAAGTASAGTFGINTGVNSIGTCGLDAGTAAIGSVLSAGAVAHDAVGTGIYPELIGAIAYATDGTAPGTAVAEGDISRLKSDRDGRLLTNTGHPASGSANDNSSSAETATELVAQPASGFSIYLDWVAISSLTAQTTTLHDEDDTTIVPIIYTGANSNIMLQFNPAIRITAVKALEYTTTAAVATSIVCGFHVAV